MRVLVICLGNTCRSPMAGGLLRRIASEQGLNVEVRTAGLAHHPSRRVAEMAVVAMQEYGIDISDEYSKPVTQDALRWADIIVAVQRSHKEYLLEDYPLLAHRVRCLDCDVQDPCCGALTEYREVRDKLEQLLCRFAFSLGPK